jgi:septal ring factor EnvC (AmiA/AmiB activator)
MMRLLRRPWIAGWLLSSALVAAQAPLPSSIPDTRRLDDRIRALETEASRLAGSARTLVAELRGLEVERDLRAAEARKAASAVAAAEAQVRQTDHRLIELEEVRARQVPAVKTQLANLYKHGRLGYARLFFGVDDVRELGRASRVVATLVARDGRRLEEHRRTLAAVQQQRAAQSIEARDLAARRDDAVRTRTAAERAVAAHARRMAAIDGQRDLTAQYVGELQTARDDLLRRVEGTTPGMPFAPFRGALDWPVAGKVSGLFGQAANRLGGSAVRSGIEISAPDGVSVRAVHGGTVAHAGPYAGFGNLVIVDHGNSHFSLYGYLGAISVTNGQSVPAAGEVGVVGPSPAGPTALYFELRVDGRSVDPVQWLEPR